MIFPHMLTEQKLGKLLQQNEIQIVCTNDVFDQLAAQYDIPSSEIKFIDFNRTGIFLPNREVRVGFRARFIIHLLQPPFLRDTYFALPVRGQGDSNYFVSDGRLRFGEEIIGNTEEISLDTCDVTYSRGVGLLNLNSRSRGSCAGCRACVHSYRNLYDKTVLRDDDQLITKGQIHEFFDKQEDTGTSVAALQQIAVVTGLFGSEDEVVKHMTAIFNDVLPRGFRGELLYFGCEVNTSEALRELARLEKFAVVYAIDNFTKRGRVLNPKKAGITLGDARRTMEEAASLGIKTTYAYIAGIDNLQSLEEGARFLVGVLNKFPIINIYQVQTPGQIQIMDPEAKNLEYYLKARKIFEEVFRGIDLKPNKWENYRPLWYDYFADQPLNEQNGKS